MEHSIQRYVKCSISIYQACRGFDWQLGMSTMKGFLTSME